MLWQHDKALTLITHETSSPRNKKETQRKTKQGYLLALTVEYWITTVAYWTTVSGRPVGLNSRISYWITAVAYWTAVRSSFQVDHLIQHSPKQKRKKKQGENKTKTKQNKVET